MEPPRAQRTPREEPDAEVDRLAHEVIGAAIEVHRVLGAGFLESVYEKALAIELRRREIGFERQVPIHLSYKREPVGDARLDFLVGKRLVLELKACNGLNEIHQAQVINYLRAISRPLALLINFNVLRLKDGLRRIVLTPS